MKRLCLWGWLLWACKPPAPTPLPRIVSVNPTGKGISPIELVAVIRFSEPIDPASLKEGRRIALCRAVDREQVVKLLESVGEAPPGAPVMALRPSLEDGGARLELRPLEPLEPLTAYALIVGSGITASGRSVLDPEGHKQPFVSSFETGNRPDRTPPVARWLLPPHGPVPRNLRALLVAFDEPVEGMLALRSGGAANPVAPSPQLLGLALEQPLDGEWLALSLTAIHDTSGNSAQELEPLAVAPCEDRTPPAQLPEETLVTPGELELQVSARVTELALLGAEVVLPPGEPGCGSVPPFPDSLVRWGEVRPCVGADPCGPPSRCDAALTLSGFCPGQRLWVRFSAEDLAGNRTQWEPWREVTTLPGQPRPVISEVLADAASPESGGEYVELSNMGTAPADLTGHLLVKRSAAGNLVRCSLEPLAGVIAPGGYALVVGGAYDGRYALPEGTALFRCGAAALMGGLANDRPPAFQLVAPDGTVLSSLGISVTAPRCTGRSLERIHPLGADAAEELACTRATIGTPGECNSITPGEACPRRPW